MRTDAWIKAALGMTSLCMCGGLAGMGLANYTTSGSFDFYKQPRVTYSQSDPPRRSPVETGDLAFASDYRSGGQAVEPSRDFAAFTD